MVFIFALVQASTVQAFMWLSLGAVGGSMLRFFVQKYFNAAFPLGTLFINAIGSLFAGFAVGLLKDLPGGDSFWRYGVLVGFCGALTTFSAFSVEIWGYWQARDYYHLVLYGVLTPLVGIVGVGVGYLLGSLI